MTRPYGRDRIETLPGGRIALDAPEPKGWEARRVAPLLPNRTDHPGTAVLWDDAHWEVLTVERRGAGVRYVLARWDEQNVFRGMARYDEETELEREELRREELKAEGKRGILVLLTPLAGLLPEEDQVALEYRLGVPAGRMTFTSAVLGLLFGTFSIIALVAKGLGGATFGIATWVLLLGNYLFVESFARLIVILAQGRPIGSVLALPWLIVKSLREPPRGKEEGLAPYDMRKQLEVERERVYRALQPVLALLPAESQAILQTRYGFDALSWGRTTALVLLVCGAMFAGTAVMNVLARIGGAGEILWLAAGAGLILEQTRRLARIKAGQPAGSVFGRLVEPFAKRLFLTSPAH